MSPIDGIGGNSISTDQQTMNPDNDSSSEEGGFGDVMSRVADGVLSGVAEVAPVIPGGELVGMAAEGLQELRGSAPDSMPSANDDQIDQMFEMQEQSQAFNLQYMELQQQMQEDNRRFSTMSNLMKVRHDTAKSAINNMHA